MYLNADSAAVSDCEAIHASGIDQPFNAFSSLAFLIAGVVLMALLVSRRHRNRWAGAIAVALIVEAIASFGYHAWFGPLWRVAHDLSGVALVGILIASVVVCLRSRRPLVRVQRFAIVTGAVAFGIYWLSRRGGPLCDPDSWLQGHAAWHVLAAVATALWAWGLVREDATSSTVRRS